VDLEGALDDLDGPVHAGAEAARLGQQDVTGLRRRVISEHPDHLDLEGHGLAGQRVVEVEHRAVAHQFAQHTGETALAVRRGELHHVADVVLGLRVAVLAQQARLTRWTISGLRSPKASPGARVKLARAPSSSPSSLASKAGASWPDPSVRVAGWSLKVVTTSAPSGPARR
jgi:hypothetical protein